MSPSSILVFLVSCGPDEPTSTPPCTDSFFLDGDGDTHGDPTVWTNACEAPSGYAAVADDCDDANVVVHPGADEICDGVDDDCDGTADVGALDAPLWYADLDEDRFGDEAAAVTRCEQPLGHVEIAGDCDDRDASVNPDALESCNGIDDDCDTLVDSSDASVIDGLTWYVDADGDHFGDPTAPVVACEHPLGTVADDRDCDDADAALRPDADEVCDGIDDDCDGLVDDADVGSVLGQTTFYIDSDGDGRGSLAASQEACVAPVGWVVPSDDCDDADAGVLGPLTWYYDADHDGWGLTDSTDLGCTLPNSWWSAESGDCDDADRRIHPEAAEICNDDVDNNCDGAVDEADPLVVLAIWYGDGDGDGFGEDADTVVSCEAPSGYAPLGGDCDDGDVYVNPDAPEYCDSLDNDCDGDSDESVVYVDWYADDDGDGYGAGVAENDCVAPSGYAPSSGDCDDTSATAFPGALETCTNDADDDCDGVEDNCVIDTDDPDFSVAGVYACYDGFGRTMVTPDLDGDGTADLLLVVPCPSGLLGTAGASIVYGPTSGDSTVAGLVHLQNGVVGTGLGASLAVGDSNGDGSEDVVLGNVYEPDGAYLFLGPITADRGVADIVFDDGIGDHDVSYSVDVGADLDDDGFADLVVGAPNAACAHPASSSCGAAYVAIGAPSADLDLASDAAQTYSGHDGDQLGQAVCNAGDANGDGISDLALTAPGADHGAVYLIAGGAPAGVYDASSEAFATLSWTSGSNWLADAVLVAADYDDDGTTDLVVGAGATSLSTVYLFAGARTGDADADDAAATWSSTTRYSGLGSSVAVDDLDGDGNMDVLMGAQYDSETGVAYIQFGKAEGSIDVETVASVTPPNGVESDDRFGEGVAFVPDWSGDGLPELVIDAARWGETDDDYQGKAFGFFSEEIH